MTFAVEAVTTVLSRRRRKTLESLVVEARWRHYAANPVAFMADCIQVQSPLAEDGRMPLVLFDYQESDLERYLTERYIVVLKARRLGQTTVAMAYALWKLLFRPGSNILLVSKDQRTADTALDMIDFMLSFLPPWLKARMPRQTADAAREKKWLHDNGLTSRIVSLPATKTAGAGETADLVLWDEAALAQEQEDTFRSLLPTVEGGGQMIVFSTARGAANRFARLVRSAQTDQSVFRLIFHPWFVGRLMNNKADLVASCPNGPCDDCIDWTHYEASKAEFKSEPWRFYAEHPSSIEEALRESGRSRFANLPPVEDFTNFPLRGFLEQAGSVIKFVEDEFGPLRLRPEAREGAPPWVKAVLSVDPATGQGQDYTAMAAGWIDDQGIPQRMAFWHDNMIEPVEAARQADLLGRFFNRAQIAVEKQGGYGDTIIHELVKNLSYPRMYVHRYTGHRRRKQDTAFGFPMTSAKRPLVVDLLAQWLPSTQDPDRETIEGIDPLLRHELGAFVVKEDGKVEADVGMHDDLVMSTAIWAYVLLETVGAATPAPIGEKPTQEGAQTHDLSEIWENAEQVWKQQARNNRKRASRAMRGRRRTRV